MAQFAEAQTSGRAGAVVISNLRKCLDDADGRESVLRSALADLGKHLESSVPRSIRLNVVLPPVVVFTDAAAEREGVFLGGVVADPVSGIFELFAARARSRTVDHWKRAGKRQVIGQAELVAVPIAAMIWSKILTGRDILFFGDNDSATACLVNGGSPVDDSRELVVATRRLLTGMAAAPWFCAVPSPSNIADGPSRGDWKLLEAEGATRTAARVPKELEDYVEIEEL